MNLCHPHLLATIELESCRALGTLGHHDVSGRQLKDALLEPRPCIEDPQQLRDITARQYIEFGSCRIVRFTERPTIRLKPLVERRTPELSLAFT